MISKYMCVYIDIITIMEVLGLDPKITICKIAVLPVKLYPLTLCLNIYI